MHEQKATTWFEAAYAKLRESLDSAPGYSSTRDGRHVKADRIFQRLLWGSRLFVVIPVTFTLVAAIGASIQGAVMVLWGIVAAFKLGQFESILAYLTALDVFLLAMILYVGSVGLYELFISKINGTERGYRPVLPSWMVIGTLDDLKQKLASVVTIVIAITYLSELARWADGTSRIIHSALDVFWLSAGVAVAMASLVLFARQVVARDERRDEPNAGEPKESPLVLR